MPMGAGGSHSGGGLHGGGGSHHSGGGMHGGPGGHMGGPGGHRRGPGGFGHHGPVLIFHRHYGGDGDASSMSTGTKLLIILFSILLMVGLATSIIVPAKRNEVNTCKADYNFYINMIAEAEKDPTNLIVDGTVVDWEYNYEYKKYCMWYRIDSDSSGKSRDSYLIFDEADTQRYKIDSKVKVALNKKTIDSTTNTMIVIYKNYPLSADAQYASAHKMYVVSASCCGVSFGGAFLILLIGIIKLSKDSKKKKVAQDDDTNKDKYSNTKKDVTRCPYCGAVKKGNERNCRGCGAAFEE